MNTQTKELSPGVIEIQALGRGFYLVQIGRARYTKRFNLSDVEARQLIAELQAILPGAGDPR